MTAIRADDGHRSLAAAVAHGAPPSRATAAAMAAAVALLVAAPFLLGSYQINTLSRVLAFGLLAISATLLTGVSGLPTLGQAAYFGVGAYTAAIVARDLTAVGPVQVMAAAALAGGVALVTGTLAARARGVPFLMITLALGELAYSGAVSWSFITGGSDGLSGVPRVVPLPGLGELAADGLVYYYVLVVAALVYVAARHMLRSPFGLVLRGVRDNEARLRAIGYPTRRYVLLVFTASGALAGVGGALLVTVQRFISPGDMGFSVGAMALLAAIIGGVGSLPGAVLGAGLVVLVRDYIGQRMGGSGPMLVGAMFVAVVYLLPTGLAGLRASLPWPRPRPPDGGRPRGADEEPPSIGGGSQAARDTAGATAGDAGRSEDGGVRPADPADEGSPASTTRDERP